MRYHIHHITSLVLSAFCLSSGLDAQRYKDSALPIRQRVADLLPRMTTAEKAAQLKSTWSARSKVSDTLLGNEKTMDSLFGQGIGLINPDNTQTPEEQVRYRNKIQHYLRTKTRLGIPAVFTDEAHHGLVAMDADVFPTSIGLACSWDTLLTEKIYGYIAQQAAGRGTDMVLAPVVDAARDPRWGRTGETFGEDPYLCGVMGAAVVRGFQGSRTGEILPGHVAATLKHFTGHGASIGGINQAPANEGENELRSIQMEPFRIAIERAHPAAIMPAYVAVDGVPMHANGRLLKGVLRQAWHYSGVLASDWWGIDQLYQKHLVAANRKQAALEAFEAGVTVDEPTGSNYALLPELLKEKKITIQALDSAVSYVLALKFRLGLFDKHTGDTISLQNAQAHTGQAEGRQLALQAAEESMVLLKNKNHILPLNANQYKKIAVIGPCAAVNYTGDYSGTTLHNVSLLEGIRNELKAKDSHTEVAYAKGVDLTTRDDTVSLADNGIPQTVLPDAQHNEKMIDSAVEIAKGADIIICAVGQNQQFSREAWGNLPGDMSNLNLPSNQDELVAALLQTGKPVIVYLTHGRPLSVNSIAAHADAILDGWFTGEESGNAAAKILFGDVNPSGKLTMTVPRSVGQLPVTYDHQPGEHSFPYVTEAGTPLYPFGYGLSYTTYVYGRPSISGDTLSVPVTNTGNIAGDEIVEFYVHPKVASVTQPVMALKDFARVHLEAGESKTVTFTVTKDKLAYYNRQLRRVAEPGVYELMVGASSDKVQKVEYRVE